MHGPTMRFIVNAQQARLNNIYKKYKKHPPMQPITSQSLRSIRNTPRQLHSLQQISMQHDTLPQHLVYKNELNRENVITLARNDETPWWWSEKIETCRSCFKCFKWKLYRYICWLIIEVISELFIFIVLYSVNFSAPCSFWVIFESKECVQICMHLCNSLANICICS